MYRGVFPIKNNLRDVVSWMQEVVVPPLIPVNGHCSIFIHTADARENTADRV